MTRSTARLSPREWGALGRFLFVDAGGHARLIPLYLAATTARASTRTTSRATRCSRAGSASWAPRTLTPGRAPPEPDSRGGDDAARAGLAAALVLLDATVLQRDDARHARGEREVVRDDHDCRAARLVDREEQVVNLLARRRVEVPRRLVGEEELRRQDEGARERHALLLAAGELAGPMQRAVPEAHVSNLPEHHKTEHRDRERVVALGPKCQDVLKPFLTLETQTYLFSPQKAMDERRDVLRANRKSKVQPSQQARCRKAKRARPWGERYTRRSLAKAIARGCELADRRARQDAENTKAAKECRIPVTVPETAPNEQRFIPRWRPNRLRHSFATLARREMGIEAASAGLGHAGLKITEVYAEKNLLLAAKLASKIG